MEKWRDMDWPQILVVIGANLGTTITLFLWVRSEAREEKAQTNEDRRQMISLLKGIQDEMKDFHGRLCAIEERKKEK